MFTKILYPTDFSENARLASEYVKKLFEAGAKEVIITHIYDKKKIGAWEEAQEFIELKPENIVEKEVLDKVVKMIYEKLRRMETELKEIGFKAELIVKIGNPAREIVRIAAGKKVDLIVIGEKEENGLEQLFLGSTAVKVVRDSEIPVLIVKSKRGAK